MSTRKLPTAEWRKRIPEELKRRRQWVGHRDKKPIDLNTGCAGSVSNPRSWGTFEQAVSFYDRTLAEQEAGVGFTLTPETGIVAVDFDHVRDGSAWTAPDEVRALIDAAQAATYAEVSPRARTSSGAVQALPSRTCSKSTA